MEDLYRVIRPYLAKFIVLLFCLPLFGLLRRGWFGFWGIFLPGAGEIPKVGRANWRRR